MASLSDAQLNTLRNSLKQRYAKLRKDIAEELARSEQEHYADLAGRVHDIGEESVADLLSDLNIAELDREINEVRDVEAALQRINMGSYGLCEMCGEPIGFERLQSQPAARRCVACQKKWEHSHGQTTPRL
ncbi:MAG TPA: TraR/DksA family transcriptional regulator [Gammaproteobacteria bacterium]|nr:TraR/DksA family transcriptional regulator [Gammaproteobacteria bacterium]